MRRLVTDPRDPLSRFRLASVCFAAALAFLNAGLFAFNGSLPTTLRWPEAGAALFLGAWWLYGHRRGGFPIGGWLIDMRLPLVSRRLRTYVRVGLLINFESPYMKHRCFFASLAVSMVAVALQGQPASSSTIGRRHFVGDNSSTRENRCNSIMTRRCRRGP